MPIRTINKDSDLIIGQNDVRYAEAAKRFMGNVIDANLRERLLHHQFYRGVGFRLGVLPQAGCADLLSGLGRKLSGLERFSQLRRTSRRPLATFVGKRHLLALSRSQFATALRLITALKRAVLLRTPARGFSGLTAHDASGIVRRTKARSFLAALRAKPLLWTAFDPIVWVVGNTASFTKVRLLHAHGPSLAPRFSFEVPA